MGLILSCSFPQLSTDSSLGYAAIVPGVCLPIGVVEPITKPAANSAVRTAAAQE
jgi:hypothetical protein